MDSLSLQPKINKWQTIQLPRKMYVRAKSVTNVTVITVQTTRNAIRDLKAADKRPQPVNSLKLLP
jgi:hypothetical protein